MNIHSHRMLKILALVGVLATGAVDACSCKSPEGSREDRVSAAFEQSQSVVVGEVVAVERRKISWLGGTASGQRAAISVARVFKGSLGEGDRVPVETAMQGAMCGMPMKVGDLLLLYAHDGKVIRLSYCGRSGSLLKLLDDIPVLYRLARKAGVIE